MGLDVTSRLSDEPGRVEARLRELTTLERETLTGITRHLVDAGGKRLRPLLVLAAAAAGSTYAPLPSRTIDAAACVELLHLATLYHDDVLDSAATRRGVPSGRQLWGNHRAVLGGDLLLTLAFQTAGRLGVDEVLRLNSTLAEMCIGQIDESVTQFNHNRSVDQYSMAVAGKTASLMSTACWLGASSVGAGPAARKLLSEFGTALGRAFQLIDDILDLVADEQLIGKPAGGDLRQGVYTLPVLFALEEDPDLATLLTAGISADAVREVRDRVSATTAFVRSTSLATEYIDLARRRLAEPALVPEGVELLNSIVHHVIALVDRGGLPAPLRQLTTRLEAAS